MKLPPNLVLTGLLTASALGLVKGENLHAQEQQTSVPIPQREDWRNSTVFDYTVSEELRTATVATLDTIQAIDPETFDAAIRNLQGDKKLIIKEAIPGSSTWLDVNDQGNPILIVDTNTFRVDGYHNPRTDRTEPFSTEEGYYHELRHLANPNFWNLHREYTEVNTAIESLTKDFTAHAAQHPEQFPDSLAEFGWESMFKKYYIFHKNQILHENHPILERELGAIDPFEYRNLMAAPGAHAALDMLFAQPEWSERFHGTLDGEFAYTERSMADERRCMRETDAFMQAHFDPNQERGSYLTQELPEDRQSEQIRSFSLGTATPIDPDTIVHTAPDSVRKVSAPPDTSRIKQGFLQLDGVQIESLDSSHSVPTAPPKHIPSAKEPTVKERN